MYNTMWLVMVVAGCAAGMATAAFGDDGVSATWAPGYCVVSPVFPDTLSDVMITLGGIWPDSCVPRLAGVSVIDGTVAICTEYCGECMCAMVLSSWHIEVPLSDLPVGEYEVVVGLSPYGTWDSDDPGSTPGACDAALWAGPEYAWASGGSFTVTPAPFERAALVASDPPHDGTLCKEVGNGIALTFDGPVGEAPDPPIRVKILPDGPDVSSVFDCAIAVDGSVVTLGRPGSLANQTWYRVTPAETLAVQPFVVDLCTLIGDADGNGRVMAVDLGVAWSHNGQMCPEKVAPLFDYGPSPRPDLEAEVLALQVGGTLLASDADYERILRDLALIRAVHPEVRDVIHDAPWDPQTVIVRLVDGVPTGAFEALNAYYQVTVRPMSRSLALDLPGRVHPEVLAAEYAVLPEVSYANPSYMFGGDDAISIVDQTDGVWTYLFDNGEGDCSAGCAYHIYYTFAVDAEGNVSP